MEGRHTPIDEVLSTLEGTGGEFEQRAVRLMRELYESGKFQTGIIKGPKTEDTPFRLQTLRIIELSNRQLFSNPISIGANPDENEQMLGLLKEETLLLPLSSTLGS